MYYQLKIYRLNEILSENEKSGGGLRSPALMNAFRDALLDCDLNDLGFSGPVLTWSNNRNDPHTVRCRLDRFCGSSEWMEFAPSSVVEHLNFPGSDYMPLLLWLRGSKVTRAGSNLRPWRFNAHWIQGLPIGSTAMGTRYSQEPKTPY